MKCYRVLYTPDDTAFMVYAASEEDAIGKVMKRNIEELNDGSGLDDKEYIVDEFTVDTNGTGIIAFYDCYSVHNRNNVTYEERIKE